MKVECACTGCSHNGKESGRYGFCRKENITLKFVGSLNVHGTHVFLECMHLELGKPDGNDK